MNYQETHETIQSITRFIDQSVDILKIKDINGFIFATKHWISTVYSYFKSKYGQHNDFLANFNKSNTISITNQSWTKKEYRKLLVDNVKYLKTLQKQLKQELE